MNLSEYFDSNLNTVGPPPRHILVYGPPKSGKTVAVGKLAERFKLKYIDFEDSVKSLANPELLDPRFRSNIELIRVPDKQTYPMAIETALKIMKFGSIKICHLHGKVSCPVCAKDPAAIQTTLEMDVNNPHTERDIYVFDSYSQLAESSMNYIMRNSIQKDDFDAKAGWDEYGKQGRILERIGSTIQVAPFNIVVISHEMMVEMEDGSKKIVPIGGSSNVSKVFAKYFDDVVYCEIVNRKHRLVSTTTGKANVLAGSRTGKELKDGDTLLKLFE